MEEVKKTNSGLPQAADKQTIFTKIKNFWSARWLKRKQKWEQREKRTVPQKILFAVIFVIFTAYALTLIFPFFWILLNSFKTSYEFFAEGNFMYFPKTFAPENFIKAFSQDYSGATLAGMFFMSILMATAGTLITIFTSSCAAYIVAKYKFPGRSIIYGIVIFSLIVPIVGTLPAQLRMIKTLQIFNTPLAPLFLYSGGFGFNFILLYSYFKSLSWGYAEAASVDGATDFQIFWKVMMPLSFPALIAVSIIQFIGLWNDYLGPALFMPDIPTLAVGMEIIYSITKNQLDHFPIMFASIVIAVMPVVLIFIIFSKTIMENTVVGGLKG